jgi:hypothetical protein
MGLIKWLFGKRKEKPKTVTVEESRFADWERKLNRMYDDLYSKSPEEKKDIVAGEPDKTFAPRNEPGGFFQPLSSKKGFRAILANNTLTISYTDENSVNRILINNEANQELYNKVLLALSWEDIEILMVPEFLVIKRQREEQEKLEKEKEEKALNESLKEKEIYNTRRYTANILVESGDFEGEGDAIFMKGIKLSIPPLLLDKLTELINKVNKASAAPESVKKLEEEYEGLKNFWRWCSLNPNAQARVDLFKFLNNHDLKINRNGFFFTYRRVVTKQGAKVEDKEKVEFITNEYLKVRTRWKKNPHKFRVIIDSNNKYKSEKAETVTVGGKLVGNLAELYNDVQNLIEAPLFTDNHSRTFSITIGREVRMDRKNCDSDNSVECSYGLHSGNKNFGFNGFGDTQVLCLINPMDVVSVPKYDVNKMRSCAYMPVAILKGNEKTTFLEDAEVFDLGNEYFADQVARFNDLLANNTAQELEVNQLLPPMTVEMKKQVEVLQKSFKEELANMKDALKTRVKAVSN